MTAPQNISIIDFTYHLPDDKIALHPLPERDSSKLLIYNKGYITEDVYSNIAAHLPAGSLLVFNNSKVINARIRFTKSTGGIIEVFCLEPYGAMQEYSSVMSSTASVQWKCFIGGAAKWKERFLTKEITVGAQHITIQAELLQQLNDAYLVQFSWQPQQLSFAEVIEAAGNIPLPPYIKREVDAKDAGRYQTIYAKHDGSVAAPTAGLHFTEAVFQKLAAKNISKAYVTLHVGAGTFKPVKATTMQDHVMHAEWIDVSIATIQQLMASNDKLIAVGTTSLRTLETLYWLGVKAALDPHIAKMELLQWDVYQAPLNESMLPVATALAALITWLQQHNIDRIFTQTQLLISSGYKFKMVKALVTNFHQPQSTLLLLVAAATGNDWRRIYDHALSNNFRFLSYGDGNLIFINNDEAQ